MPALKETRGKPAVDDDRTDDRGGKSHQIIEEFT
jgi:hypothetical protein